MTISYAPFNDHWNYFLAIERDFDVLSRYIHFSKDNEGAYSIELAKIIMASAQEVDVVMKLLCKLVDTEFKGDNIYKYREKIVKEFPEFTEEAVEIKRYGLSFRPWKNWGATGGAGDSPEWWRANNGIKHNRADEFKKANLKNAANALGGLLIAVAYHYRMEIKKNDGQVLGWKELTSRLEPESSLMTLSGSYYHRPGTLEVVEW